MDGGWLVLVTLEEEEGIRALMLWWSGEERL